MFGWLKVLFDIIKNISSSIDEYKKDTVVQSLPTLTYVNRAKKLIDLNKLEEAEKFLLQALELPHEDALVYKYLGFVYEKMNELQKAVDNFQRSADINPQDKNIWQKLGFALISTKEYEKAEKAFENANKVQAGNSDTYTGWGMALMKMQNFELAREKFAVASNINRHNFSAVFLWAVMEIKLEMYDKAEMKLSFLANVCPNEANTFEFARLKYMKNDVDNAIHYVNKSLAYNPNMLPGYILLGQLLAKKYDIENSLKAFETAEGRDLKDVNLYLEWGKVLFGFEKFEQSLEKFVKALEYDAENVDLCANLGLCYAELDKIEQAQELLNKVIEKEQNHEKVKQAQAIIAFKKGDLEKALEYFRANDEEALNCFYLAKCYEAYNNDVKVIDSYEAAISRNPKSVSAYSNYVRYLMDKKDYAEAQRKLRKILKFEGFDPLLLNLMFYVSYILVKENICEYNVKETLAIAEKFEKVNSDLFEYPEQKTELERLLHNIRESD